MAKPFFKRRLPFFGSNAMLILCMVFFLLPFALRGARLSIDAMQNNVADWLPDHYQETKDLAEFRRYFVGDQFIVLSGPWCKEGNGTYDKVIRELSKETLTYEDKLRRENKEEEIRAHRLGDDLGLLFAGKEHKDWGEHQEKWLLGKKGQWYWINRKGQLYRWDGQNNVIDGAKRAFERMIHGKNKVDGTYITTFGEQPDDANDKPNEFYEDPQKICARPFKSITSGPDAFAMLAGENGTLRMQKTLGENDAATFEAEMEAHKRLTGALYGPTPAKTFTWTYESLLRHVENAQLDTLKSKPIYREKFNFFLEKTLEENFDKQLANLNNATQSEKLETWYAMWTALEITPPARQTCIIVTLNDPVLEELDRAVGRPLLGKARGRILEVASGECGIEPENLHLGGPPVDNVAIDEEGTSTLVRLISLAGLIGITLAYLSFRSVKITAALFFVGGVAAVTSLSFVWFANSTMDAILMSMPSLVYVLGLSGAVHVVNYYRDACHEDGEENAVATAVKHGLFPCTLAAFTTALGLISLYSSNLTPIKKFGLFSALAVMATVILLFTYLPAALTVFPPGFKKKEESDEPEKGLTASVGRFWDWIGELVIKRHAWVAIIAILMTGYFAYGISRIETSVHLLKLFDHKAKILADYRWMEENLGELVPAEILVMFDKDQQREVWKEEQEQLAKRNAPVNEEGDENAPQQIVDFDRFQHDLKYSMLERIELSQRVRLQLEKFFGPDGLEIVGKGMSTDLFVPLQIVDTNIEYDGVGVRRAVNIQLNNKRDTMLAEDYLAIARNPVGQEVDEDDVIDPAKDGREMWRISIRLAALSDVDYGQFISDLKAVIEPMMTAYDFRTRILNVLQSEDLTDTIPNAQILVLGPNPDSQTVESPKMAEGTAISQHVDQTYIFSDTLQDLIENRGFAKFTNRHKPTQKMEDGTVVQRKGYYWLDYASLITDKDGNEKDEETIAKINEQIAKQIATVDCVVLIEENSNFSAEFVKQNAKQLVDCRDHKFEVDPLTNMPVSGRMTAMEKKNAGQQVGVTAMYTGIVPIVYKAQRALLFSLRDSIGMAFVMIAIVMMLLLRDWKEPISPNNLLNFRGGMLSMLPNVFPVVLIFGAMGHMGFKVDIGSMMTASVAMGVAVDDTIHFLNWYRQGLAKGLVRTDAIRQAYRRVATAMTHTTLIGGLGLSAFALSTFTPTQRFGVLMLFLLAAALVGDLILLPAILAGPLGKYFGKEKTAEERAAIQAARDAATESRLRLVADEYDPYTPASEADAVASDIHPDSLKHLRQNRTGTEGDTV